MPSPVTVLPAVSRWAPPDPDVDQHAVTIEISIVVRCGAAAMETAAELAERLSTIAAGVVRQGRLLPGGPVAVPDVASAPAVGGGTAPRRWWAGPGRPDQPSCCCDQ
ncbi:hypothetical protein [Micromonospora sp. IBHARD004]|uniref:hypothetical protein n=1 Tax=Micromonospora sp. IBHARD004 TaxID=3457764 RepID=UPI0040595B0F